jgi:hypothetical protein
LPESTIISISECRFQEPAPGPAKSCCSIGSGSATLVDLEDFLTSVSDVHSVYLDTNPTFLENADTDLALIMKANPDPQKKASFSPLFSALYSF